jgi:hypothetical protein
MAILEGAAGIWSDDFSSGTLESPWTFTDELVGDGASSYEFEGAGTSDARCNITVFGGALARHWGDGNAYAPRIEQDVTTATDFEIEAKFDVYPSINETTCGIGIVCAGDDITIQAYYYGDEFRVESAKGATPGADTLESPSGPIYFRIKYVDSTDTFTTYFSTTGTFGAAHDSWVYTATNQQVAFFAGNFIDAPANLAKCDYFFETSAPIDPEDAGTRRIMVIS